jgi:hypothetical protein
MAFCLTSATRAQRIVAPVCSMLTLLLMQERQARPKHAPLPPPHNLYLHLAEDHRLEVCAFKGFDHEKIYSLILA